MTKREAAQFTCDGGCDTAEPEWQLSDGGLPELPDGWTAYRTRHYCRDCTAFIELTMDAIPGRRRDRRYTNAKIQSVSVLDGLVNLEVYLVGGWAVPPLGSTATLVWDDPDE